MPNSFIAHDAKGKQYQIIITTKSIDTANKTTGKGSTPGSMSLKTTNGESVNMVEQGVYEITRIDGSKVRVTSNDPKAP
jgi:hypothetical protein